MSRYDVAGGSNLVSGMGRSGGESTDHLELLQAPAPKYINRRSTFATQVITGKLGYKVRYQLHEFDASLSPKKSQKYF